MNRDQVVALVKRRLGYRTDLDADILIEMDLAQLDLTYHTVPTPWFLKIAFPAVIGPDPGIDMVPVPGIFQLPPAFISFVYPDHSIVYTDDRRAPLRAVPFPQMRDELIPQLVPDARPQCYAQRDAHYIQFWPAPDQFYNAEFYCYSGEELIENLGPENIEQRNRWTTREPELLAVATALRIAPTLRDAELTAYLQSEQDRLLKRLELQTIQREEQGFDRIINESLFTDSVPEGAFR